MDTDTQKIEVRDLRGGDWMWTHKDVVFCPFISSTAFRVYAALAAYADNKNQRSWPGLKTLAANISMSKSSVIRAIKSLEETGLIKVERGEGHSNIYTLLRVEKIKKPGKKRSESTHHQIIDFFYKTTQKTRRMRPTISGADVKNLKRVLESGVVSSTQLEQVILYFLASRHFKKFSPHISTILSAGVLNGIVNRMKNDSEFWRELEQMQIYYFSSDTMNDPEAVKQNKNIALKRNVNLLARSMSIGTL